MFKMNATHSLGYGEYTFLYRNRILLVLAGLVNCIVVYAQGISEIGLSKDMTIKGRVFNERKIPIPNTLIYLKNSKTKSTTTDADGFFNFHCNAKTLTLIFTHLEYQQLDYTIHIKDIGANNDLYEVILKDKITQLEEVQLFGAMTVSTALSLNAIKKEHAMVAGGTSIAIMTPEVQRLETLKDALKLEPGVVIQEFFGANDQPRISIRGSGIQSNPQRRGLYFLQDGIPVNFADGSFIIGVIDPSLSESIEVFKGANALRYGAATLGGAINLNSRTGRHAPGLTVKTEGGSYDYGAVNVSVGKQMKQSDAFLSVSGSRQTGFRQYNNNNKLGISANWGQRFSDRWDNRTFFNYSYINFDIPGPLTKGMIEENPSQINKGISLPIVMGPNIERDLPKREAMVVRLANKTALRTGASTKLHITGYYQYIQDRFVFPIVLSTQRSYGHDIGGTLTFSQPLGTHTITAGLIGSYGFMDRQGHINKNGLDSFMFSKDKLNAANLTLFVEDYYRLNPRLHIIGNLQMVYNERNSKDVFPNPELRPWYSHSSHKYRYFHSNNASSNQAFKAFNPRIGFIYNAGVKNGIQLFGNVSSSYEPPTFDELVGTEVTNNINTSPKKLFSVELDKQTAVTAEIGTRHEGRRYGWNISLYQSWLQNELLEVKDFVLGVKKTKNYPHTIHRGVELGVTAIPFQGLFSPKKEDFMSLRAMYTYSDFYFSTGAYKDNKLAGIPPHFLSGTLTYNYPEKLFLSFNVETQPEKSPVDHTNTLYQPAYTIYGFRVGFHGWKKLSFYVEGKNVFNKRYASSYIINDQIHPPPIPFPKFTADNITFFMPGQTRAFYVGLTYNL